MACVANKYCEYKSSAGYCDYAGPGCAQESILTAEAVIKKLTADYIGFAVEDVDEKEVTIVVRRRKQ